MTTVLEQDAAAAVADRIKAVRERIRTAAQQVGRDPAQINLVAVSKAQPDGRVLAALEAGERLFGEN